VLVAVDERGALLWFEETHPYAQRGINGELVEFAIKIIKTIIKEVDYQNFTGCASVIGRYFISLECPAA
jgi:hypothetical protein